MGVELTEALRRLCVEIGWSYAVFWRAAGFPIPKHLVWGDGHWFGKLQFSGSDDLNSHVNSLGDDSIDELVNKAMVPQVHVIGVGIVGQAASTGNHGWIVRNFTGDNEYTLKHFPDLNIQFLAGIQTIVIIPVFPHGAVQFGSTKRVMENLLFVNHARTSFMQLAFEQGSSIHGLTQKAFGPNSFPRPSISPTISDYLFRDNCSNVDRSSSKICNHQLAISSAARSLNHSSSSLSMQIVASLPTIHQAGNTVFSLNKQLEDELAEAHATSNEDLMSLSRLPVMSGGSLSFMGSGNQEPAIALKASVDAMLEDFDTDFFLHKIEAMDSAKDMEMLASARTSEIALNHSNVSRANNLRDVNSLNENRSVPIISYTNNNLLKKAHGALMPDHLKHGDDLHSSGISSSSCGLSLTGLQEYQFGSSSIFGAHGDGSCKVEKLLKMCAENDSSFIFMPKEKSPSFSQPVTSGDDLFDVLGLYDSGKASEEQLTWTVPARSTQLNLSPILDPTEDAISCTEVFSESNTDQLLDAVVSSVCHSARRSSDETLLWKASATKVNVSSTPSPSSNDGSASSGQKQGDYVSSSKMVKSNAEAADSTSHGKRVDEISKLNRKRARPGETPRPRPKDRQLIMDRVKELREIVPNGAKCSIDALLEKTVEHLLFLQSVSKHADKLKKTGEPKIIFEDGVAVLKDNFRGGATWAFEVGSQTMTCPIIVEDLNPPRELLVEMLCEERGIFLEIADLIRGLGLTILNGVMEARRDKIWARFAVEANKDVTRMEIFLSLVHLLEPTVGRSGITQHSIHNSTKIPQKIFNLPCVPATAVSNPLQ